MGMYVGARVFKKIKGTEDEFVLHAARYPNYKREIELDKKYGGYPPLEYLIDYLDKEVIEESEAVCDELQKEYAKEIEEKYRLCDGIEEANLQEGVESESIFSVSRDYPLANKVAKYFKQQDMYFSKEITYEELEKMAEEIKNLYDATEYIKRYKFEDVIFEVYVY